MSRFPAEKMISKTDAPTVIDAIMEFYDTYGTPLIHRTDNGPPFNSKEFQAFSKEQGIEHTTSFAYHPQANNVECFMKPLGKAMKIVYNTGSGKQKQLKQFLAQYRATPHSATNMAPGDILLRNGVSRTFPGHKAPTRNQGSHGNGANKKRGKR